MGIGAAAAIDNKRRVLDHFNGNFHPFYAKYTPNLKKINGDEWAARTEQPKACPACKRYDWDRLKDRGANCAKALAADLRRR